MSYLEHHGILGQKWGDRNGPPYPLRGRDYSKQEIKEVFDARKKSKYNIYNKKHFDTVLKENDVVRTLSFDKNRTKNADMFYASTNQHDHDIYNSFFNDPVPMHKYDENGKDLGTGICFKSRINNEITKNIKVASEDSGADAFIKLYSKSRDFSNFVDDPKRMQSLFVDEKYKFDGYKEARDALERIRNTDTPKEEDLRTAYRMFNYVIPSQGSDVAKQRARMFTELKNEGYGAMLDTNDAIYGSFKANNPVIVFDMDSVKFKNAEDTSIGSVAVSYLAAIGQKAIGR